MWNDFTLSNVRIYCKKIDEYLNAPALYKSLLDIDKKMYPNVEWEYPDLKKITFKTNDDLADALYEYMVKILLKLLL